MNQEQRDLLTAAETELTVERTLLATARANLNTPSNTGETLDRLRERYDAAAKRVESAKAAVRRLGGVA